MFGYGARALEDGRTFLLAEPEKALLDLLYLYPFYKEAASLETLRLDEDFMQEEMNVERLKDYCARFACKALDKRVNLLLKTYGL